MSSNCGVCDVKIDDVKNSVKCMGSCGMYFHATCTRLKTVEALRKLGTKKDKWNCDICKENSSTSATSGSSVACTPLTQDFLVRTLDAFKDEVFRELRGYNAEVTELRKSVEFLSTAVDVANKLMAEVKEELKLVQKENEKLKLDREKDSRCIRELQIKIRNLEQYSRRENIEISGVPETRGEDVMAVVSDVGAALRVAVDQGSIVAAHRVPSYNKARTPSIIVRFQTRSYRDIWIESYKNNKTITAKDVNALFPTNKLYVSEHLSPELKFMLTKVKEHCKKINYTYVWAKEGKIFVRKNPGDKCIRINDLDDLDNLK